MNAGLVYKVRRQGGELHISVYTKQGRFEGGVYLTPLPNSNAPHGVVLMTHVPSAKTWEGGKPVEDAVYLHLEHAEETTA